MPVGELRQTFQVRYMIYQPKLADIFAVDAIVSPLNGNAVIPHMSVSIYRLVQLTITVIGIHLELVGFHHGLSFRLSYPVLKDVGSTTERWRKTYPRKTKKLYLFSHMISSIKLAKAICIPSINAWGLDLKGFLIIRS